MNVVQAKLVNESQGEIDIFGDIADSKWWDDDVTPKDIINQLNKLKDIKELAVNINSYGGSVFAGNAIFNIIDNFKKTNDCKVTTRIFGLAASMGSGIAMVGDEIVMPENALMMLHKPMADAYGNVEKLQKTIELLNKSEEALVSNYMRHFKGSEDELKELLANETWLTANEAFEYGLCTEVAESIEIAASAKGVNVGNVEYHSEIAKIIKSKIPDAKIRETEDKEEMQIAYNEKLSNFGITQEMFDTFKTPQEIIDKVCEFEIPVAELESTEEFISEEKAEKILGAKDTAENILSDVKAYRECKDSIEENKQKAKDYDRLLSVAVEDALKEGVKAKGEAFNSERWTKTFKTFTYDEIVEQGKEWHEEAKNVLKAGVKIAEPVSSINNNIIENKNFDF